MKELIVILNGLNMDIYIVDYNLNYQNLKAVNEWTNLLITWNAIKIKIGAQYYKFCSNISNTRRIYVLESWLTYSKQIEILEIGTCPRATGDFSSKVE